MENKNDVSVNITVKTEENSKEQVSNTSELNDCLNNNESKSSESGKPTQVPVDGSVLFSPSGNTDSGLR